MIWWAWTSNTTFLPDFEQREKSLDSLFLSLVCIFVEVCLLSSLWSFSLYSPNKDTQHAPTSWRISKHQSKITLAEENGWKYRHMSWIMIMGKEVSRYSPKEGFLFPFVLFILYLIFWSSFQRYVIMGQDYFCLFAFFFLLVGASQTKLSHILWESKVPQIGFLTIAPFIIVLQGHIYIYILRIYAFSFMEYVRYDS